MTDETGPAPPSSGEDAPPFDAPGEGAAAEEIAGAVSVDGAASRKDATAGAVRRGRTRLVPALLALVGAAVPFLAMCTEQHWRFIVPVGFVSLLVSTWGIVDLFGAFDGDEERVASRVTLAELKPRLAELVASVGSLILFLTLAVAGVLPKQIWTAAILVPALFLWTVAAVYRLGRELGAWRDAELGLLSRQGFWLVVVNVLLYVPLLGSYSLSDPWETHYGEVSREMLARDDWISTWWAQDGWFWSKPVLDFWIQALDFSLLGVKYMPDGMLSAASHGHFPQPEWAARLPVFLLTLAGVYALYRSVARAFGRRTGFIAGLVLTTMPYWYLIAHQTMTDMPYVGPLTTAMALTFLGFVTDPDKKLRSTELRIGNHTFRLSALHLVLAAVVLSSVPQILYLASRNLTLFLRPGMTGFRPHTDEFFAGSGGGNCGLPGNQGCAPEHPFAREVFALNLGSARIPLGMPLHFAILWAALAGVFLWLERREQRQQRVYFLGAWYFLALAMMGKGAPGLVLPIVTALGFVAVTRRWRDLERLELGSMLLIVACVGLPWYVQMYMRHGPPFIDRLIMHDMYKRAFVHVHDTNQGDDTSFRYYIWQLGYGLFPWTGLTAGGLLWWLRRSDRTRDLQGDAASLMMVWFLAAFGMFTITLTKFHHYILPLVPATAVLTGVVIDRMLGEGSPAAPGKLKGYVAGLVSGAALLVYGIARLFPRRIGGEAFTGTPPSSGYGVLFIVLGAILTFVAMRKLGARAAKHERTPTEQYDSLALSALALASLVVVGLVGRDLFMDSTATPGQLRLMNLFTYNYSRPWPDTLDYTGTLVGFTCVAGLASLGMVVPLFRRHATAFFCATSIVWTAWGLDIYLYKAAPHWGQREALLVYYRDRTDENQPFVAYQMNWKGENFYTSNKVPAFVSSGEPFKRWVDEQKAKGIHRIYFITEHGRNGSLKRELGDPRTFTELTDKTLNNKFFVARVEY
jgi:4-amino-4-deoxy-L-arabinose transferase-like glycosyltransferase